MTYEQLFDNDRLPEHLVVLGAGPIGLEMAQAYRRLGSEVTVIGPTLLPKEEPEAQQTIEEVFLHEGIRVVKARVAEAHPGSRGFQLVHDGGVILGDLLLVATGRRPCVDGLALDRAGVAVSEDGIRVDSCLRTSARHIYAAGDVTGAPQFTHYAGWQAFQAVRNALLPGNSRGFTEVLPRVTFLDPEVAHVGLGEAAAKERHGDDVRVCRFDLAHADRAICDGEVSGFIKVVTQRSGRVLGATIVAARAGEMIAELTLAVRLKLRLADIASTIHAYPTWSTPVQQLASIDAIEQFVGGTMGKATISLAGLRGRKGSAPQV